MKKTKLNRGPLERRRRWIKIYPVECMDGSIRYQLEADERGVWYDLINFSALCSSAGTISDRDGRPYPHSFIANRLNIALELLERTLVKCIEEGRITEGDDGLHITNWKYYQSEYDRIKNYQQAYRQKKADSQADDPDKFQHQKHAHLTELPDWIKKETWDAFLEMRKKKKSYPSDHAKELLIKELDKLRLAGDNPIEVLNQSIMRNYTGVFPLNRKGGNNDTEKYRGNPSQKPAGAFADIITAEENREG